MKTGFARALNEIVHDGVATLREMSGPDAADCSVSHLRDVANLKSEKELSPEKRERLSRWLIAERGEVRHMQGLLGSDGGAYVLPDQVELDQCIEQEAHDLLKEVTYTEDALDEGEPSSARIHAAKIRGLAELIIEEVKAVRKMHESRESGTITIDR